MKNITLSLKSFSTFLLILMVTGLSAQTITLSLPTGAIGPCTETSAGTSLDFVRDASCLANVVIVPGDGSLFTTDDVIFTTAATSFSYSFPNAGEFAILCDAPGTVATVVGCFEVSPSTAIPTLGEWGLIFLLLTSLIIGVVVLRKSPASSMKATA